MDGSTWAYDQRWSDEARDDDNVLFNVAYGLGRFVAVGGGAKIGHILATKDGREWTILPEQKGRVATVVFGRNRFVCGHGATLLWSSDGESFLRGGKLPWEGSAHPRRSACGDTEAGFRFLILGDVDLQQTRERVSWRATTADGTLYIHTSLNTPSARDVSYGSGHFVVVGPNGLVESSHDGETWHRHLLGVSDDFSRVIWTGQRFVISGGKRAWTSPDGFTWTAESYQVPGSIAWACEPRLVTSPLALSLSWPGKLHSTDDLVTWKKVAIPSGPSLEAIAFAED